METLSTNPATSSHASVDGDVDESRRAFLGATINPFRDYSLGDMIGDAIYEAVNGPKSTIICDVRNKKC